MVQFNTKDNEILVKIVYYGPGLSGKTTNLQKLHELMDPSQKTDLFSVNTMEDRTLFFDLLPVDLGYIYGNSIKLQIYTVPGQVHYDSTRRIVLSGADGVIFIADSSKAKLHENVQSINNLYHNLQANRINIKEIPLVMQFNKRDLPDALPIDVLNKKLNFRNIPNFPSVAVTGEGVIETFAEAVQQTVKTIFEKYQLSKSVKNLNELIEKLNASIMAKAKAAAEKNIQKDDVIVPKVRLGGKTVLKYTHSIEDDDRGSQDQLLQKALTSNMETARLYTDLKNSQQALIKKNEELSVLYKQLEKSNNDNNKIRRFLESLVNFAGDAIISFNDLWVIQNWNQAAEQLFGYLRTEILNQNINILFPDEGMAELNRIITIVTNGKVVKGFETSLLDKEKTKIPVSITFSPIKNKNETIIAFTTIIRDLSAMTQMQKHLFSIQKYEAMGFLLPIFTPLLSGADGLNSAGLKAVLDAFGPDQEKRVSDFSINKFVEEIHDLLKDELAKRNISWNMQLNPHLPLVTIETSPFIQGFVNLLINSMEAVRGIEDAKITIGTHFMDGQILLQIINNGKGIPPEAMNQIFSPSIDEETLTMNLRLRTSRQLFNQLKSLMRVDSSLKKGTKITLKIPQE